ncbi:MAG: family 16 glycosylhydrolase [Saprospiraceae bacterium]|nr:family 16 glycosylhydrolase [Saprospiraceae bacterium]
MVDPVLPQVRVDPLTDDEGDVTRSVFIDFRLDRASSEVVTLSIRSVNGTAEAGQDFVSIDNEVLQFQAGQVALPLRVDILGDEAAEEDEYFTIEIVEAMGAGIEVASAQITLLNDDEGGLVIPETGYSTPDSYPGMTLIWQDEFDGDALNGDYWTHEIGTGCPNLCGWGNNEWQYYRPDNTYLQEGNLIIEARKESFSGSNYTSSRIITRDKFDFQYGRVDIRAALPRGQGLWPALWMLGANIGSVGWPASGEIDIMEMVGGESRDNWVHGTAHWSNAGQHAQYGDSISLAPGALQQEFHVFSIIWTATKIEWYVNDMKYNTLSTVPGDLSEFRNPFFLIMNVAVGGNWPGYPNAQTQFPQRMIVDYIRVFQEE